MRNRKRLAMFLATIFVIANLAFWMVLKHDMNLFMCGLWFGVLIVLVIKD